MISRDYKANGGCEVKGRRIVVDDGGREVMAYPLF